MAESIHLSMRVRTTAQRAFEVLSGYERLPQIIPTMEFCRVLESHGPRKIVEQGTPTVLGVSLQARVVFEITERPPDRIEFRCVGGDFRRFDRAQGCAVAGQLLRPGRSPDAGARGPGQTQADV